MRTPSLIVFGFLLLAFAGTAFAGSLTPPGVVGSTMRTLQELYDTIAGTFDSTAIVADQNGSLIEHLKFIETNMSSLGVSSNSLDFDEFANAMTLDANTTIASAGFTLGTNANFEVAGQASVSSLTVNGVAVTGGGVAPNSLDFDDFTNTMTVDASTSITAGALALTFDHASVSGNFNVGARVKIAAAIPQTSAGANLITNGTFTGSATGWTLGAGGGSPDWAYAANAVTHVSGGGTAALEPTTPLTVTAATSYLIRYKVNPYTSGSVVASIGGTSGAAVAFNNVNGSWLYSEVLTAINSTNFKLTPSTDFAGSVDDVAVFQLTAAAPALVLTQTGSPMEFRTGTVNSFSTFIGSRAGQFAGPNTDTAIGDGALSSLNSSGFSNSAFGTNALAALAAGDVNTGIGAAAINSIRAGTANTAIGASTLRALIAGNLNTAIGREAGRLVLTNGSFNTFLGADTSPLTDGISNCMALGYGTSCTASNQLVIGGEVGTEGFSDAYIGHGVSKAAPTSMVLHATGGTGTNNAGSPFIIAGGISTGSAVPGAIQFQTGSTLGTGTTAQTLATRMSIIGDGNVGIGTTTPAHLLHIASGGDGNILRLSDSDGTCDHNPESGAETVTCTSDESLKSDIHDAPSVLDSLDGFRVREYTVKSSGDRAVGVIAQEVQKTHPEIVSADSSGLLVVEQPNPWSLVKAIQELNDRLDSTNQSGLSFSKLFTKVVDRFESAFGIEFGKGLVKAKSVQAERICIDTTCITEDELRALLRSVK